VQYAIIKVIPICHYNCDKLFTTQSTKFLADKYNEKKILIISIKSIDLVEIIFIIAITKMFVLYIVCMMCSRFIVARLQVN
jgi:hypothetical protein